MKTSEILREAPPDYFPTMELAWVTTQIHNTISISPNPMALCQRFTTIRLADQSPKNDVWVVVKTIVAEYD